MRDWHKFGWLRPHATSFAELRNLLAIADRDIADAEAADLSVDWKFGIAYNAALKLCTMLLYDAGFMPEKNLAHYRTLHSIQFTLGKKRKDDAEYLDVCRAKRNHVEYDYVGGASETDARELLDFARELREEVVRKLRPRYPQLGLPEGKKPRGMSPSVPPSQMPDSK